ncbi:MAG: 3-deoxy-7-phosphoheptulonate synthase [Fibrobacterota bacterium]
MSFTFKKKLKSPAEMKEDIPVSAAVSDIKAANDTVLKNIFEGRDPRFIFIIGPCSAHDPAAVLDYVNRLAQVQEKVADKIVIVPRIYTNKPRTLGVGYKGLLHQPDPSREPSIAEGIAAIRHLHSKVISQTHLPIADEMLYPENHEYVSDLLSYVAIGARSVENQIHRLTASGVGIPVGMKNTTGGNTKIMLDSVQAAQSSHIFAYAGHEVETSGNPLAHTILRGSQRRNGEHVPNYHYEDIQQVCAKYAERDLTNPAIIVDANHSNSGKKYSEQPRIIREILNNREYSPLQKDRVKGVMVESFIEGGNQKPEDGVYGKSITDPCLGWEETERLILDSAEQL